MLREIVEANGPKIENTTKTNQAKYLPKLEAFLVETIVSLYGTAVKNDDESLIRLLNESIDELKSIYDEALLKEDKRILEIPVIYKERHRKLSKKIADKISAPSMDGKPVSENLALEIKQGVLKLTGTTEHIYEHFVKKPNKGNFDADKILHPVYYQGEYCSDKEIITGFALGSIYQTVHDMDGMLLNLKNTPKRIKYHPIVMALNVSRDFFRDNENLLACEEERLKFYQDHDKGMIGLSMLAVTMLSWFQLDVLDAELNRFSPGITSLVDELDKQKSIFHYITDEAKTFADRIELATSLDELYVTIKDDESPIISTDVFLDVKDGVLNTKYHPSPDSSGAANLSVIMDRWYLLRKIAEKADTLCGKMLHEYGSINDENSLKAYTNASKRLGKIFDFYTQHLAEACHDMNFPNIAALCLKGVKSDVFLSAPFSVLSEMASSSIFNEMDARMLLQKLSSRPLQAPEALPKITSNEMVNLVAKLELRIGGLLETKEFSNLTWDLEPYFGDFGASVITKIAKEQTAMVALNNKAEHQIDMGFLEGPQL